MTADFTLFIWNDRIQESEVRIRMSLNLFQDEKILASNTISCE